MPSYPISYVNDNGSVIHTNDIEADDLAAAMREASRRGRCFARVEHRDTAADRRRAVYQAREDARFHAQRHARWGRLDPAPIYEALGRADDELTLALADALRRGQIEAALALIGPSAPAE